MASGSSYVIKAIQKLGIMEVLKRSYWQSTLKIGELKGMDQFGNKYYENNDYPLGQNRWVEFGKKTTIPEASRIPPEWHLWIHQAAKVPATKLEETPKKFHANHIENPTGNPEAYSPTSFLLNPKNLKNPKGKSDGIEEWDPELVHNQAKRGHL